MVKITVAEFCEQFNIDQPTSNAFLRTLVSLNKAKVVGSVPSPSGRGRGSLIYEIPTHINIFSEQQSFPEQSFPVPIFEKAGNYFLEPINQENE